MFSIDQIGGAATSKAATDSSKQLGQKDFLQLLVAQLKNQDPGNPTDNAEFLGQIAQFGMVSGIDGLQTSFGSMAGSLYGTQAMQASSLIGKQVLAESGSTELKEGKTVDGVLDLPADSFGATVYVLDEAGKPVDTVQLGPAQAGFQKFTWDGVDDDGKPFEPGRYHLGAEAGIDGELEAVPLRTFNTVESVSVDRNNNTVHLHLGGGQSVGLSQVSEFK